MEVLKMARNKYPEETRRLILDVAEKLFIEKGYDDTSIKDIIDGLGGLTKGVIYHHFKSKEDILDQVLTRLANESESIVTKQIDQVDANGLEKIQMYLIASIKDYKALSIIYESRILQKSKRMIGEQYNESFSIAIPEVKKMIQSGVEDGSIVTEFPEEGAEIMVVLLNLWIAIQMPNWSREEFKRRFIALKKILDSLNLFFITEKTLEAFDELCEYLNCIEKKTIAD
jgi:AcrR family transcriptional regulator